MPLAFIKAVNVPIGVCAPYPERRSQCCYIHGIMFGECELMSDNACPDSTSREGKYKPGPVMKSHSPKHGAEE
jgi:hypothetical protein